MNKITKIKYYMESLCVYNLWDDEIFAALFELLNSADEYMLNTYSDFFKLVSKTGSVKEHISNCILTNDNVFTKAACSGNVSDEITQAAKNDLRMLEEIASISADEIIDNIENEDIKEILLSLPKFSSGTAKAPLTSNWDKQINGLISFHQTNGYGKFAKHIAFTWRDGELCPVTSIDPITLNDLKNYEEQRHKVVDNTESFVSGHPANNVLLYGDRGTGKSSTVHALLNAYHNQGLRMIEIPKSTVSQLTLIREAIADSPMKFIIYIDDLSFDSNDSSFSELKAALEGSLSGKQANTLIYATSNRRHLIKESFSDRQNEMNMNDIMQEQLSLSDRFGLSITFINPDKKNYLEIIEKICDDRRLDVDKEHLFSQAEKWAIRRGGRSPRCAKQFIDFVESCVRRGKEW
ncbi:MAG: ATP-binding protein [Clostridium sp.]|nr:ATP-binding protein [Clostridium sp.]